MLGNIVYAFNIYNLLRQLDVYTVITGEYSGIATLLFFSAQKEKRYALPHTSITLTQPFYDDSMADISKASIPDDNRITHHIKNFINIVKDNLAFNDSRFDLIFLKKNICMWNTSYKMNISSKSLKKMNIAKIINSIEELNENPESEVHYENKAETLSLVVRHTPEPNYSFENRPEKK